jgi:hypothetical protein
VLFERRLREGLVAGTISLAYRRWRRPQVVAGGRYRLGAGAGVVRIDHVDVVSTETITPDDVRAAGFATRAQLLADLVGPDDASIYRIEFGGPVEQDPRDRLRQSAADLDQLAQRVGRIGGAAATLRAIGEQPGVRAADLMGPLGWDDLHRFKLHVRRLKELGLTISLPVGYRLSPRGEALLSNPHHAQ